MPLRAHVAAFAILAPWVAPSFATLPLDPNLCLVDVQDGLPSETKVEPHWRIGLKVVNYPGKIQPYVQTQNRRHADWTVQDWTIDEDRRFVPYADPIPLTLCYPSCWTMDPGAKRVVTWAGRRTGILAAALDESKFAIVPGTESIGQGYTAPIYVSRLGGTLFVSGTVQPSGNGLVMILKGSQLKRLPGTENFELISRMIDAPQLSAVIFATEREGSRQSEIVGLRDDGSVRRLGSIEMGQRSQRGSRILRLQYLENPECIIVDIGTRSWMIPIRRTGNDFSAGNPKDLGTDSDSDGVYLEFLNQSLVLGPARRSWLSKSHYAVRKLGTAGYAHIPGGLVDNPWESVGGHISIFEVPWWRTALVNGGHGLYRYDGIAISLIRGSGSSSLGGRVAPHLLPSVKKVLLSTLGGIYEMTPRGAITRLAAPFMNGQCCAQTADMPESRLGLISAPDDSGIYSIDETATIRLIPGSEGKGGGASGPYLGIMPGRHEMIIASDTGLHLLIDRRFSGSNGCPKLE